MLPLLLLSLLGLASSLFTESRLKELNVDAHKVGRIAIVDFQQVQCDKVTIDCHNNGEDNVVEEMMKAALTRLCAPYNAGQPRNRRSVLSVIGIGLSAFHLLYDYSNAQRLNALDTRISELDIKIKELSRALLMIGRQQKAKLFVESMEELFYKNRIGPNADVFKINASGVFAQVLAASSIYVNECNVADLSLSGFICFPTLKYETTAYSVKHQGLASQRTRIVLGYPELMTFRALNERIEEKQIDMSQCHATKNATYVCPESALLDHDCKVFSDGTCQTRLFRDTTFKGTYSHFVDVHIDSALLSALSGEAIGVHVRYENGKITVTENEGPVIENGRAVLLVLLLLLAIAAALGAVWSVPRGILKAWQLCALRLGKAKLVREVTSNLNRTYIDADRTVLHRGIELTKFEPSGSGPVALLNMDGQKARKWTVHNLRGPEDWKSAECVLQWKKKHAILHPVEDGQEDGLFKLDVISVPK
uniref:Protein kinase domain-containing protein n=1 Tax=Steinernema glaseri TaxID=37863 RepID=A0A1I8A454_9BILA